MKILIGIDGSDCSKNAVKGAVQMNCPSGTEFLVVSVVEGKTQEETEQARTVVALSVRALQKAFPQNLVAGDVVVGLPVERILSLAQTWSPDLIIVGSHSRTGVAEFFLGSVSRAVLKGAPCAVRIIRQAAESQGSPEANNVLLALDESENSRNTIKHVLSFPWAKNTKFRCVTVVPQLREPMYADPQYPQFHNLEEQQQRLCSRAGEWLQEEVERINSQFGICASFEVRTGDASSEILQAAKDWLATLIVIGSNSRQFLQRLLLGNVAETIATHAPCSVEITRLPAGDDKNSCCGKCLPDQDFLKTKASTQERSSLSTKS